MVWNPESKRVGVWFGLGTTQVSNRVNQRFKTLNPNTLGCDLPWGLPKSQIEWTNGSEPWIQTPRGVIWLGDYPSLKSGEPTVGNPESKHVGVWLGLGTTQVSNRVNQRFGTQNPNTLGCDLAWGLPKSQIEWTNGSEPWIQTRGGVIWLGDYPSLKSSEPTVWNPESKQVGVWFGLGTTQVSNRVNQRFGSLNPNTLGSDLAWGLTKSQIEWTNGLEPWIQTRCGVIWHGDFPSLKSSEPTVRNPESKHLGVWFCLGTTQVSNRVNQRLGTLNPNTLGCDLAWGLTKCQIEWTNGLEPWIHTLWGVIWLGHFPSLKSSEPTVWNPESKPVRVWFGLRTTQVSNRVNQRLGILNPNTLGCDLGWGLPKSQIVWTNGSEPWIQTRWGVICLGDYPSLKTSEPTIWNPESKRVGVWFGLGTKQVPNRVNQRFGSLNPNALGCDLAWGLTKSQIEWTNGLEP